MFGERCYGRPNCGHSTNWTCPCTCDEYVDEPFPRELSEREKIEKEISQLRADIYATKTIIATHERALEKYQGMYKNLVERLKNVA